MSEAPSDDAVILVSSDGHVGPRMAEDLRPYCPQKHLAAYDEFLEAVEPVRQWWKGGGAPGADRPGHYDSTARNADLEADGIVAEVIFQFSFNGELIPFAPTFGLSDNPNDAEQALVGLQIYNRWLADFCNELPGRRIGLVQLPIWDVDTAVREVEAGAAAGLRGINFPNMRESLLPYDDPAYDRLWAAAAANDMPLTTHAGAVNPQGYSRQILLMMEVGGTLGRRAIHRLIFSGAFDRFPNLKLVMTEQPGLWQPGLMQEMDSAYKAAVRSMAHQDTGVFTRNAVAGKKIENPGKWNGYAVNTLRQEPLAKIPSEYFHSNVFVGASMLAHFEAAAAVEGGFDDCMMWGGDYPHPEGPRNWLDDDPETSQFRRHLQNTFHGLPHDAIRGMAGANAIRCYRLDHDMLARAAAAIGAPTVEQLATPPTGELKGAHGTGGLSFRTEQWV